MWLPEACGVAKLHQCRIDVALHVLDDHRTGIANIWARDAVARQ